MKKNAQIVGVSGDSVASHQKFKAKYDLPFCLIADTGSALRTAFGADKRSTFVIGPDGTITAVWPKVSVAGHAQEVLQSIS